MLRKRHPLLLLSLGVVLCALPAPSAGISHPQPKSATASGRLPDDGEPAAPAETKPDPKPDTFLIFAALGTALLIALFAFPRREK